MEREFKERVSKKNKNKKHVFLLARGLPLEAASFCFFIQKDKNNKNTCPIILYTFVPLLSGRERERERENID